MISVSLSRVQTALTVLPYFKVSFMDSVNEWFEVLVYPDQPLNLDIVPVRSGVQVDGQGCTFIAQNERKILAKQFAQLVQANGYAEVEIKLLQRAYSQIPDGRLEAFLNVRKSGMDMGWTIDGLFEIEKAYELVPDGDAKNTLRQWYSDIDANACLRLGRSVGGGYTIVHSELPGDDAGESIEYYASAAAAFEVDILPVELLEVIAADEPDYLEVFFHIGKAGLFKFGLRVPQPSDNLIRAALFGLAGDTGMETVAAYEGSLGVQRPEYIDFYTDVKGFGAQFYYTPVD